MSSGGGGDGGAGARQEEEERRKAALRARIDNLYGVPTSGRHRITEHKLVDMGQTGEQGEPLQMLMPVTREVPFGDTKAAEEAQRAMEEEQTKLAGATRGYYADELGKNYQEAERNTRFKLARQGLLGGSEDVYQQGDVREDRDLGATRVDEAVRRAIANLTSQREQERLNSINLVNAGAGDSAVSAAQAGLRNSFENVASQQKANLFTDLFANSADVVANQNAEAQQAALLGRYRDRLSTFFPASSSSSGRVTPSA